MHKTKLTATGGGYAPDGWKQWPDDPDFSFQYVRVLAAAQDGASTIGECFQTAGRIEAFDRDGWHREWLATAERGVARAEAAKAAGHRLTARANWIRATNYFRAAEFFLDPTDPRRLPTFDRIEACSHRALALFEPAGEVVKVPYENGAHLDAYFLPTPVGQGPRPAVIAFGGLDEFKDELIQEMERYALARGMSLLLVDLPGQGGTLRRQGLKARFDIEVPIAACVDYLLTRSDVDPARIGLYGASLGGYYAVRGAAREPRLACVVSDGAQWKLASAAELLRKAPEGMTATLSKWVFGARDLDELIEVARPFDLEGVAGDVRCPLLIVIGELDEWGTQNAENVYDAVKASGGEVTMKHFSPEETGAAHCQIDNPTLGMELICDWMADRLAERNGNFARLAQSWADIWNGDLSLTDSTVHENFVSHAAPLAGGPTADATGRDNLNTWVSGIRALIPDLKFTIQVGPLITGPFVVLRWRAQGTYQGGLPGAAEQAVGRPLVFYGTDVLKVADGLLAEYWANADSLWFVQQLGMREVPALG